MRANRKAPKPDWQFDGTTITVRIPMTFVRRGSRKVIVAPDSGDAWALGRPRPDEALIRAVVRAHRWRRLLEQGKYRSAAEVAEAETLTRSFCYWRVSFVRRDRFPPSRTWPRSARQRSVG